MNMKRIGLSLCLLGSVVGCAQIKDYTDDTMIGIRDEYASHTAWKRWQDCYADVEYKSHFAEGFMDGYQSMMAGGNGCQPALPPRDYWQVCYQNPEGQEKIRQWFNGYSHGVLAASQDGVEGINQIMISPVLQQQLIPAGAEHHIQMDPVAEPNNMLPPGPVPAPPAGDYKTTQVDADSNPFTRLNPSVDLSFENEETSSNQQDLVQVTGFETL